MQQTHLINKYGKPHSFLIKTLGIYTQALLLVVGALWCMSKHIIERFHRRLVTRRLYGPRRISLDDDQVMVVTLVRDAGWFMDMFLDHHFKMGATHILIIDNGSVDDTLSIAQKYGERVTVLKNNLPVKRYESLLRSELAQRAAKGGWFLFVDADELAELPAPIDRFVAYCNDQGYTAVLGQMLDRFSGLPYSALRNLDYRSAVQAMRFYSLGDVVSIDYNDSLAVPFSWFMSTNSCDDPEGRLKRGGVRTEVFGEDPFLSKHSLVRNLSNLTPMSHPHCASGVKVADVCLLLNHFKMAGSWIMRDQKTLQFAIWTHGEDARRLAQVGENEDFLLIAAEPQLWCGLEDLQEKGFLHVSERFRKVLQHL